MIFITGDTHQNWMNRLNRHSFPEQRELSKDDYVIICGDFGIWENTNEEKHNLDWLDSRNFTTLFVDGNHENFDILEEYPVTQWHGGNVHVVRPSVLHLMRGQVFEIGGKKFFTFGGARSHDISEGIIELDDPDFKWKKKKFERDPSWDVRFHHINWWEREFPSEEEMQIGLTNLEKHGNKVDYIVTHSPFTSVLMKMSKENQRDEFTDYLQKIQQNVEYRNWIFGHMHVNKMFGEEKAVCLREQIVEIP